jgi:hypothetical protein
MSPIAHRDAAVIVEQALTAVFDPAVVRQLREDSPLAGLGMAPADAVCVSDAVADAADRVGWSVDLGDADLADALTVADLVLAVESRAVEATP